MKTSSFPSADPLDGTELIGVVQDGTTVQTTTGAVSEIVSGYSYVKVGYQSSTYGFSSIAIGHESAALGSTSSMAIGNDAFTSGYLPLNVGSPSYVTGHMSAAVGAYNFNASGDRVTMLGAGNEGSANYATLVGTANNASQTYQVAIGRNLRNDEAKNSVFIGYATYGVAPYHAVGIGNEIGAAGPYGVIIGNNSKVNYRGVTIGYHSGFQNVPFYASGEASIAIGASAYTPVGPTIGIGNNILSVYSSTAVGDGVLAYSETVAIGYGLNAMEMRAVAIGQSLYAVTGSVALGSYHCSTIKPYSMVLGSANSPAIGGTFVNAGVFTNAVLSPLVMHQKLIGHTISPKEATAGWGNGSYTATVTYDTPGVIGNSYSFAIVNGEADAPLFATWDGTTLTVSLATDDPSTNTLANIGALFPTNGFSFGYTTGFDSTVISFTFNEAFDNGVDGSPTAILTVDGNSPAPGTNLPAIYQDSIATITGTVAGATPNLFDSSGDAAYFTLGPVMVVQKTDETYYFIGTPTFTMASHTVGATDWNAPVMEIAEDSLSMSISVNNTAADVDWMAHLIFEAGKNNAP